MSGNNVAEGRQNVNAGGMNIDKMGFFVVERPVECIDPLRRKEVSCSTD